MDVPYRNRLRWLVLALLLLAGFGETGRAADRDERPGRVTPSLPEDFERLLAARFSFSRTELGALRRGEAVVKLLDGADGEELVTLGAQRFDADPERVVDGLRRLVLPPISGSEARRAPFGSPPHLEDLAAVSLSPDVVSGLANCRPGGCIVKLPAAAMRRFREEVDWQARDAESRANALFRELLLSTLGSYLAGGGAALPRIDDKESPVEPEREFRRLLDSSPLDDIDTGVAGFLADFPAPAPEGIESLFFWTREKLGPRFVTALRHRCVREADDVSDWSVLATRQIYANHFFRAALELALVVPRPEGGCYLLRTDRARIDPLTGMAKLARGKLRDSVRTAMVDELASLGGAISRQR